MAFRNMKNIRASGRRLVDSKNSDESQRQVVRNLRRKGLDDTDIDNISVDALFSKKAPKRVRRKKR